jgi:hypothetical protein
MMKRNTEVNVAHLIEHLDERKGKSPQTIDENQGDYRNPWKRFWHTDAIFLILGRLSLGNIRPI